MSDDGARVFVTQEVVRRSEDGALRAKFDLSDAEAYGELVFLFGHGPVALAPSMMRDVMIRRLNEHRFDWRQDYLILIGDNTIAHALGGTLARRVGAEFVRILRWNGRRCNYDVVVYEY